MSTFELWLYCLVTMHAGLWLVCLQSGVELKDIAIATLIGVGGGVLAFVPGKHEVGYDTYAHFMTYPFVAFMVSFVAIFVRHRDVICRKMTEGDLFLLSLSLLYMISPWHTPHKVIGCLALIPTLCVFWFAATVRPVGQRLVILLSLWSLILTGIFCVEQFVPCFHYISDHWKTIDPKQYGEFFEFTSGVVLTSATGVVFLASILPLIALIRGRGESSESYHERLQRTDMPFIRSRILTLQIPVAVILLITLIHGLPLLANWYFEFVSYPVAMGYAMLISPVLTFALANFLVRAPTGAQKPYKS